MRGIVVEAGKKDAVLLMENGEFVKIKKRGCTVGQEIEKKPVNIHRFSVMAACVAAFVLISGTAWAYNTPSGYIYVDINPSLRLDLNCFDRVINVVALNDDAQSLLESYSFRYATPEDCIAEITSACRKEKYLNGEAAIEIDVAANDNVSEQVYSVTKSLENEDYRVHVCHIDENDNEKAMNLQTSPGRLDAIERYTEKFGGTVEENAQKLHALSKKAIDDLLAGDTQVQVSHGENHHTNHENMSNNRLSAIEEYSEKFGGTVEENKQKLKGVSVHEIYDMCE